MTTWVKKAPLDCMTWKQAAAPMVVSAVANTTVMSMRAGGRRGAAEFLDDGGGHGILAMKLSTMGAKVPVGAPMTRSATPPKLRMVAMSRVFTQPKRSRSSSCALSTRMVAAAMFGLGQSISPLAVARPSRSASGGMRALMVASMARMCMSRCRLALVRY